MTHAAKLADYIQAIISKTDGLQHAPADQVLSKDVIALMIKQKQYSTPTMELAKIIITVAKGNPEILNGLGVGSSVSYEVWKSNAIAQHPAGVLILAGTDAAPQMPINVSSFG